ncbi:hypothetical protein GCM10010486_79780 [Nonomuraea roseoviolacea subsp. carminata]
MWEGLIRAMEAGRRGQNRYMVLNYLTVRDGLGEDCEALQGMARTNLTSAELAVLQTARGVGRLRVGEDPRSGRHRLAGVVRR